MQVEIPSSYDYGDITKRRIRRTEPQKKKMVAISMYRGNHHKVPDVPRRWTMPGRNLSFKEFKCLFHRCKRALSRLSLNSNPNLSLHVKTELVTNRKDASPSERPGSSGKQKLAEVKREEIDGNRAREDENGRCDGFEGALAGGSEGGDRLRIDMELLSKNETEHEGAANDKAMLKETAEEVPSQAHKEVEERLQVLNAKKHNLVQVLKQILSAEEELKSRSIIQQPGTTATRPYAGAHIDDAAIHNNTQTPIVLRLCGASSSSESPLRRAAAVSQHNMAPQPSRWSPRVGPSQAGNLSAVGLTVSASGTNYIASSTSPAASGGTSVFRETRRQSPWN